MATDCPLPLMLVLAPAELSPIDGLSCAQSYSLAQLEISPVVVFTACGVLVQARSPCVDSTSCLCVVPDDRSSNRTALISRDSRLGSPARAVPTAVPASWCTPAARSDTGGIYVSIPLTLPEVCSIRYRLACDGPCGDNNNISLVRQGP